MTTTNNKIERLQNKLTAIANAIADFKEDGGIYAIRRILDLNKRADKVEAQLKELTK